MEIKAYAKLPKEAMKIRTAVFIEEQKFKTEFDEIDERSTHLVAFDGSTPVATCRIYCKNSSGKEFIIGRIAVIKDYRGRDIGSYILNAAEREIVKCGGKEALLHSQCAAKEFYGKNGYLKCSEIDYDEDCPHIWMNKKLNT